MGDMALGIGRLGHITLSIALILPHRFAAIPRMQETVAVLVGRRLVFRRNQSDQPSDLVVAVLGNRPQRSLFGNQPTLVVIGLEVLCAIRLDPAHQPRLVVMLVNLFAAIGVFNHHTAVVVPGIARIHLRKRRPVPDASRGFAGSFPLPKETCPTGQLPLKNDVLVVVVVAFAFAGGIGRFDQVDDKRRSGRQPVFARYARRLPACRPDESSDSRRRPCAGARSATAASARRRCRGA